MGVALACALAGCIDPSDRRPGLRLGGEVVSDLPDDWTWSNEFREIAVEVSTPYLLPHSVTVWCAASEKGLFLGARNPDDKNWPGWVTDDPDVRLKIGERVYEVRLAVIDDPAGLREVQRAYTAKYDLPARAPGEGPPMRYWRVVPRS